MAEIKDKTIDVLGYYNGVYGEADTLSVPFNDRVHFFGDGVYDATYAHNYKIYALDDHVDRFFNSAGLLDINLPYTKAELKAILQSMVNKSKHPDQFVYWQATRGTQVRNHTYPANIVSNLWITIKAGKVKDQTKEVKYDVLTAEDTRFFHCNIKTLNLLPSVTASQTAESAGCQETILHRGTRVTECAHSNVHILKGGKFITAQTDNLILPGISRKRSIRKCYELGIPVLEVAFTLDELFAADEILISSAGTLCAAVKTIDGKPVGGKDPVTLQKIQTALYNEYLDETK